MAQTQTLTNTRVARIKAPDPSGRQTLHWDADLKGFAVLASGVSNTKTYIFQGRLKDRKTRRTTIGSCQTFSVEEARDRAKRLSAEIADGKDPRQEMQKARAQGKTLNDWLEQYLTETKTLRPNSVTNYRYMMNRYLGDWQKKTLREITSETVLDTMTKLGNENGEAAANLAMRVFRAVYNFALDRDQTLPANPTRRLKKAWFQVEARTRMEWSTSFRHSTMRLMLWRTPRCGTTSSSCCSPACVVPRPQG